MSRQAPNHNPTSTRPKGGKRGFTVLELMVVVAIIGILAGIAIPTFLSQKRKAQDAKAISAIRNVTTVFREKTSAQHDQKFPGANTAEVVDILEALEPSYSYTRYASAGPHNVSIFRSSSTLISYAALSESGTCWFIVDDLSQGFELFSNQDVEELIALPTADCGATMALGIPVPDPNAEPPAVEDVMDDELLLAFCQNSCFYSSSWGDPHIVTFDGLGYEFQAIGEYTAARTTGDLGGAPDVQIQLRTGNPDPSGRVTYTTGVAAQIGNHTVSMVAGEGLRINGEDVHVPDTSIYVLGEGVGAENLERGYIARLDETYPRYRIVWPGDQNMYASRPVIDIWEINDKQYNVNVLLPTDYAALMEGLWGNADGDTVIGGGDTTTGPYDDLMIGDGAADYLAVPVSNYHIHTTYAQYWAVEQEDSLFYTNGHSYLARDPDYPARYVEDENPAKPFADFDPEDVVEAVQACEEAGITPNLVEACAYDWLIGGSSPAARNAAKYGALRAHQPRLVNAYDEWDQLLTFNGLADTNDLSPGDVANLIPGWIRQTNGSSGITMSINAEALRVRDSAGHITGPTSAQERYRRIRRDGIVTTDFTLQADVWAPGVAGTGHTSTSFGLLVSDGTNMWWARVTPTTVQDGNADISDPENVYFTNLNSRYAQIRIVKEDNTAKLYVDGEEIFELTPTDGTSYGNTIWVGMIENAYGGQPGWGLGEATFDNIGYATEAKGAANMSIWAPASGWHHSLFFSDGQMPDHHGWFQRKTSDIRGIEPVIEDNKLVITDVNSGTSAQERWWRYILPNAVPTNLTYQMNVQVPGGANGQDNTAFGVSLADGTNMWWVRFMPTSVSDGNQALGTPGYTYSTNLHSRAAQIRLVKRGTQVKVYVDGVEVFELTPVPAGDTPLITSDAFGNSIALGYIRTYDTTYAPDNYHPSRVTTGRGSVILDDIRISAYPMDGENTDTWAYNTFYHTWTFEDGNQPHQQKGWLWNGNSTPSITFEEDALTITDTIDGSSSSSTYARWVLPGTVTENYVAQASVKVPGTTVGQTSDGYGLLISDGEDMYWIRVMPTHISDGNTPVGTPAKTYTTNLYDRFAQIRIVKSPGGAVAYIDGQYAFDLTPADGSSWGNKVAFGAIQTTAGAAGHGTAKVSFLDVSLGAKPAAGTGMSSFTPNPWFYQEDFSDGQTLRAKGWNLHNNSSGITATVEAPSMVMTDPSSGNSGSSNHTTFRMPYTVTENFIYEAAVAVPGLDGTGVHTSTSFGMLISDGTNMWWVRLSKDGIEDGNDETDTYAIDLSSAYAVIRITKTGENVTASVNGGQVLTLTPAEAGSWGNTVAIGQIASKADGQAPGYNAGRIYFTNVNLGL